MAIGRNKYVLCPSALAGPGGQGYHRLEGVRFTVGLNDRKQVLLPLQRVDFIIGKGGKMLKKISSLARTDMERFMGTKIYLQTWVKVTYTSQPMTGCTPSALQAR